MFFRNLTLFRFAADTSHDLILQLDDALEEHTLRPCGPLEMSTYGFVAPDSEAPETMVHWLPDHTAAMATFASQDKILPVAVVNQALAEKVRAIAETEGRAIGGRKRRRLKGEILDQLLPRAFARETRTGIWLDIEHGWVAIDTSSRKRAEQVLSGLRDALGSFPAVPLAPEKPVHRLLTSWLTESETHRMPLRGWNLDDSCQLVDPVGAGSGMVRCVHQNLDSDEVREHLRSGKRVRKLGLTLDERMGLVLGDDLTVHQLRFFDVITDELENIQNPADETQARFFVMTAELRHLLANLESTFELPRPSYQLAESQRQAA